MGRRAPTVGSDHPRAELVRGAESAVTADLAEADVGDAEFLSKRVDRRLSNAIVLLAGGAARRAGVSHMLLRCC